MKLKIGLGLIAGFAWFLVIAMAEAASYPDLATATMPWGSIVAVVITSVGSAVLLLRWAIAWGLGLSAGLVVGLLLGLLVDGPIPPLEQERVMLLTIPRSFQVGVGSLVVWTALGVSTTLTICRWRTSTIDADGRRFRRPSAGTRAG